MPTLAPDVQKEHDKQNIKLAVDNCIFTVKDGKLLVLLIEMKNKFKGLWALPGGLIENNETLGTAAQRILKEETGLSEYYLEQLYTFSRLKRDPFARVISTAYFALLPDINIELKPSAKYTSVRWYPVKKLPALAYDHEHIIKYAKQRLAWKISYTNVAWSLLPSKFTLTELQKVFEAALDKKLDKRNFRKKIEKVALLKETKQSKLEGAHRPARLYEFISKKKKIIEII